MLCLEKTDDLAAKDQRARPAPLGHQDPQAHKANPTTRQDPLVLKGCKVCKVHLVRKASAATQDQRARCLDRKGLQAHKVQRAPCLALLAHRARKA